MRKLLFLLLAIVTLTSTTRPQQQYLLASATLSEKDWKMHIDTGFQIQYPNEWELSLTKQMGASFILFSPQENKEDLFRENVNLIVQDIKGMNIDLDKYAQISEDQIKRLMNNSKILGSKVVERNGSRFYQIVYTADMGMYHLKFMQYYFIKNAKAYVLTFTIDQKTYDNYIGLGEQIMDSFVLLN